MELNNFWIWIWRRGSKICIGGGETAVCVRFPLASVKGATHTISCFFFFFSKKSYRRFSLLCFRPLQLVLYHHHSSFLPNLVPCQIGTIAAHRRPSLSLSVYNKFLCVYVVLRESADSLVIYNSNNNTSVAYFLLFCLRFIEIFQCLCNIISLALRIREPNFLSLENYNSCP
jgi:hypothetical protein